MNHLITAFVLMTTLTTSIAQDGKAATIKRKFSQETSVRISIQADKSVIWALLTNASDYTRWNSTITSLEGTIAKGEKLRLKSYLDEKRTFKPKVKEFEPENRMVWGDGQGKRQFTLTDKGDGTVEFYMHEKIGGGIMYPMYRKYLPPFVESFEKFAADLKREAETIQKTK